MRSALSFKRLGKTFTDSPHPTPRGPLQAVLGRLDRLVDWERRDRSRGAERLMRVDLAPIADLMTRLGRPQDSFRAVHLAGSKGKGSTALLIAEGLRRAGHRSGLFTSPHVEHVHERIVVDGRTIEDEALAWALEQALDARDRAVEASAAGAMATWFDVLTAAAFVHFRSAGARFAVVECGLGGRLDSTNVVAPMLTVLTRIELEHTDILGDSLAKIAAEKAGILAPGVPAVTVEVPGRSEVVASLRRAASLLDVSLVCVPLAGIDSLHGRNMALAIAALERLGAGSAGLSDQAGLPLGAHLLESPSRWGPLPSLPGRLERGSVGTVPVVLDGAHVPASLAAVLEDLKSDTTLIGPLTCLFGCGQDKDAEGLLKTLAPFADRTLCTRAGSGPHASATDLAALATRLGHSAEAVDDPARALTEALSAAGNSGGWVLVTGSLHLVGALRSSIRLTKC